MQSIIRDRNRPQKQVWRARIVLLTADGQGTTAVMRAVGKGKSVVWRWQERFMHEGVDGLTRDKTRPSRIPAAADRDRSFISAARRTHPNVPVRSRPDDLRRGREVALKGNSSVSVARPATGRKRRIPLIAAHPGEGALPNREFEGGDFGNSPR